MNAKLFLVISAIAILAQSTCWPSRSGSAPACTSSWDFNRVASHALSP